jgi:mannose-1-phosphate guanylyltransferase
MNKYENINQLSISEIMTPDPVSVTPETPLITAHRLLTKHKITSLPVINGDSFVDADLCNFVNFHFSQNNKASILCTSVKDASRYGSVKVSPNRKVISFNEKAKISRPGYISAGVYLFNRSTIDDISNSGASLEKDYLSNQDKETIGVMAGDFKFLDIGTSESLSNAPLVLNHFLNKFRILGS